MSIYDDWLEAKRVETEAVEIRRAIEDKITAQLGLGKLHDLSIARAEQAMRLEAQGATKR